jgi:hypothetical protein
MLILLTEREKMPFNFGGQRSNEWMIEQAKEYYPGWSILFDRIYDYLEATGKEYAIEQIKEKFGGLRFYFSCADGYEAGIDNKVDQIADQSYKICEVCGEPGILRNSETSVRENIYWLKTLCDKHDADQ